MAEDRKTVKTYLSAFVSITVVLLIASMLIYTLLNIKLVSDLLKQDIGFSIILKNDAKDIEISKMQKMLEFRPYVLSTKLITKEEAAKNFKEDMGEDFEDILGYNPLLSSIEIRLNPVYANNDSLKVIEQSLVKESVVYEVSYQKNLVDAISNNVNRIVWVLFIAGLIILFMTFILIHNSVSQYIYTKRFEIKTMQLVGANSGFICRPFVSAAVLIGFFAALVSNVLFVGMLFLLQNEFGEFIHLFDVKIISTLVLIVLILGVLLSWIFSWVSVRYFLSKKSNDIYN